MLKVSVLDIPLVSRDRWVWIAEWMVRFLNESTWISIVECRRALSEKLLANTFWLGTIYVDMTQKSGPHS
jgi:hypothetical protein